MLLNISTAICTQVEKVAVRDCSSSTFKASNVGSSVDTLFDLVLRGKDESKHFLRRVSKYPLWSSVNFRASEGGFTNMSVNCALAHSMQWSIRLGKFRRVHIGIVSSSSESFVSL